jgi:ribosomal protein S6 kinase alpha-5
VSVADFELMKLVGEGGYGRVYLVRKKTGEDKGHLYAMKVLDKAEVTKHPKTIKTAKTEREILESIVECPFLATMHYAFQTAESLYLVLEFVQGGDFMTRLSNLKTFNEEQVRFYIAEIVVALEQLHKVRSKKFSFCTKSLISCFISAQHSSP